MRKRIGVVSIAPNARDHLGIPFETFYRSFGRNTGNYMFTQAMFRQFNADMVHIGLDFSPETVNRELDHIVIPAANWLNNKAKWDPLTELIERIEVPITMIGLGLQASTTDLNDVDVSASAIRFVKSVARKSRLVSVRGSFTRDWLHYIGISNVIATGCPSLYMRLGDVATPTREAGIVLQSTRYGLNESFIMEDDVNRLIFKLAGKLDAHMIYQSEIEELDYLLYGYNAHNLEHKSARHLPALYGVKNMDALLDYLNRKGRFFFDLERWANFLRGAHGLIGTRLHGSIMALNSGVPAILVPHDSRTNEMAEFARIPTINKALIKDELTTQDFERLISHADTDSYYEARRKNSHVYMDFLSDSGLPVTRDGLLQ